MELEYIIGGVILGIITVILGVYVSFTARCKGPLLSNPWIMMTKEERERELAKVDKKAEYRQLTIVMLGLTLGFGYFSIVCFSSFLLPLFPVWIIAGILPIYAIVSYVKSQQK